VPSLPRAPGAPDEKLRIHEEWLQGILTGQKPLASFDYAGPFTEAMLLGNLALRCGQRIEWNSSALRVTNSESAQALVHKAYRRGFELTPV
jgi:hypothetical protein